MNKKDNQPRKYRPGLMSLMLRLVEFYEDAEGAVRFRFIRGNRRERFRICPN